MKYQLMIRALPDAVPAQLRHEAICRVFDSVGSLRCETKTVPDPGKQSHVEIALKGDPKVRGSVTYQNRIYTRDEAEFDDYIQLTFDPKRLDLAEFVRDVFRPLCAASEAYVGYVGDEEFIYHDFERNRGVNLRDSILRIYPIAFVSADLCKRVLRRTPQEVCERLDGVAQVFSGGVLIVANTSPIDFESSLECSDRLTDIVMGDLASTN